MSTAGGNSAKGVFLSSTNLAYKFQKLKSTLHHEMIHAQDPSLTAGRRGSKTFQAIADMKKAGMDDRAIAAKMRMPLARMRSFLPTAGPVGGDTYLASSVEFNANISQFIKHLRDRVGQNPSLVPVLKDWVRGGMKKNLPNGFDYDDWYELKDSWGRDPELWKKTQTILANFVLEAEAGAGPRQMQMSAPHSKKMRYGDKITYVSGRYRDKSVGTFDQENPDGTVTVRTGGLGSMTINRADIVNVEPARPREQLLTGKYDMATGEPKPPRMSPRPSEPQRTPEPVAAPRPARSSEPETPRFTSMAAETPPEPQVASGPFKATQANANLMKPGMIVRRKGSWGGYKIRGVNPNGVDAYPLDRDGNVETRNGRPKMMTLQWWDMRDFEVTES